MYYAKFICQRVNPARFGDDNTSSIIPALETGAVASIAAATFGPLGAFLPLAVEDDPQDAAKIAPVFTAIPKSVTETISSTPSESKSSFPWGKILLVTGVVGVSGYALSQVATI